MSACLAWGPTDLLWRTWSAFAGLFADSLEKVLFSASQGRGIARGRTNERYGLFFEIPKLQMELSRLNDERAVEAKRTLLLRYMERARLLGVDVIRAAMPLEALTQAVKAASFA
jgi:hypothetical protein